MQRPPVPAGKSKSAEKQKASTEALAIFNYWQQKLSRPKAKLDEKRKRKIIQALKNYSAEDLRLAIDGCARSPYHQGQNDSGQRYDDVELIFRDCSHIEKFIDASSSTPKQNFSGNKSSPASQDLWAGAL